MRGVNRAGHGFANQGAEILAWTIRIGLACLAFASESKADEPGKRPNIVLIMSDDQGWGDVRSHGNPKIDTPVLDKLARDGARFDRFFVSPVCAPTRASLLTGRYHLRTGVYGVTRGFETMRAEEVTLAEALRGVGYVTGIFGKWHNGAHYPNHPNGQGFDEFFGFCAGHWNNYFDTELERNRQPVETKGYITDVLTDAALDFIEKNKAKNFFCYIPYNAPHGPFQVPDQYFRKYEAKGLDDKNAAVYGMVENIDDNVGRLLAKLRELELLDNTIVIFLTDNGPNGNRYNGGMRGRKGSVYEGGVRVPCFVLWKGHIRPGTKIKEIASHIDWLPTLSRLAGVSKLETKPLDGRDLSPLLLGQAKEWPDRAIFTHQARRGKVLPYPGSLRTQKYRLVHPRKDRWELYDMVADPGQKKNIAAAQPQILSTLRETYRETYKEVSSREHERPRVPVGYEKAPVVEMPAPEAYFQGKIRYAGGAGWANDWLANWRSTADQVSWKLDVVRGGTFEVELLYCCSKKDVGAKLQLEIGDTKRLAVVNVPQDPKPLPSPDRVRRGEVYEKKWAKLSFGRLLLKKGKTELQLRALAIPGTQALQLKAVRLRRVD